MQIHAEISYVHGLRPLCQRNFSYRVKGTSHQTLRTLPRWELSLEWTTIMESLSETWALSSNHSINFSKVTRNLSINEEEEAFKKAKDALSSSNILVHYDPSLPVILESDASLYGIGEFIFYPFPNGGTRLIAYASSSLKSSESF